MLEEQSRTKRLTPTLSPSQRLPPIPEPPPIPILLTEENSERAVAMNAVTQTRDPFSVITRHNLSEDLRIRIMLFAMNVELLPDEDPSVLVAQDETTQRGTIQLPLEYVGKVPGLFWLTQLNVRLTEELENAGDIWISLKLRGVPSNKALISIGSSD